MMVILINTVSSKLSAEYSLESTVITLSEWYHIPAHEIAGPVYVLLHIYMTVAYYNS